MVPLLAKDVPSELVALLRSDARDDADRRQRGAEEGVAVAQRHHLASQFPLTFGSRRVGHRVLRELDGAETRDLLFVGGIAPAAEYPLSLPEHVLSGSLRQRHRHREQLTPRVLFPMRRRRTSDTPAVVHPLLPFECRPAQAARLRRLLQRVELLGREAHQSNFPPAFLKARNCGRVRVMHSTRSSNSAAWSSGIISRRLG